MAAETGIDLGLAHFAVLSDGRKIASPKFLRRAERKLRKAQQALSRKAKGSGNRDKARVRVARVHAKVADSRRDWLHKESTASSAKTKRCTWRTCAWPGWPGPGWPSRCTMPGWSAFTAMLEYKARKHGREFRRTGRFEPTSQVCSACGARDGPKPLSVRDLDLRGVRDGP